MIMITNKCHIRINVNQNDYDSDRYISYQQDGLVFSYAMTKKHTARSRGLAGLPTSVRANQEEDDDDEDDEEEKTKMKMKTMMKMNTKMICMYI